jgi:hypothetical protein
LARGVDHGSVNEAFRTASFPENAGRAARRTGKGLQAKNNVPGGVNCQKIAGLPAASRDCCMAHRDAVTVNGSGRILLDGGPSKRGCRMDAWEFRDSSRYLLDTGFLMDATSRKGATRCNIAKRCNTVQHRENVQHGATLVGALRGSGPSFRAAVGYEWII